MSPRTRTRSTSSANLLTPPNKESASPALTNSCPTRTYQDEMRIRGKMRAEMRTKIQARISCDEERERGYVAILTELRSSVVAMIVSKILRTVNVGT